MSLRWRLALALALLAGLATVATASFAYVSTRDRLYAENDRFLAERSASYRKGPGTEGPPPLVDTGPLGEPMPAPSDRGVGGPNLTSVLGASTSSAAPSAPASGASTSGAPPNSAATAGGSATGPGPGGPLARYDTSSQLLDASGAVVAAWGPVTLPVDATDQAIAASGRGHRYHTVTVDGVPFRVCTVGVDVGALQVARDISETSRVLAALRWRFGLVGLGVVGAAVAAGWLIARRTTRPLEELTTAAEHVAGTGELDHDGLGTSEAVSRRDETGRLARSFATMLAALARSRQQQQQLVQDASHELRTPLTSLRTNIEVLARHRELPTDQRDALMADLRSELGELTTLLDELVLVASDQRDDEPVQPVVLDELVGLVVERARRRHGAAIRVEGSGGVVVAPPGALERVVTNLLDNAAKFGPPGQDIDVHLAGGRVSVRDRGPGIDPADRTRIFDRFYRARSARPLPGSGLGLSIVRQVVVANGGTVFADNDPRGGAVVGFELPLVTPPAPDRPIRPSSGTAGTAGTPSDLPASQRA